MLDRKNRVLIKGANSHCDAPTEVLQILVCHYAKLGSSDSEVRTQSSVQSETRIEPPSRADQPDSWLSIRPTDASFWIDRWPRRYEAEPQQINPRLKRKSSDEPSMCLDPRSGTIPFFRGSCFDVPGSLACFKLYREIGGCHVQRARDSDDMPHSVKSKLTCPNGFFREPGTF